MQSCYQLMVVVVGSITVGLHIDCVWYELLNVPVITLTVLICQNDGQTLDFSIIV